MREVENAVRDAVRDPLREAVRRHQLFGAGDRIAIGLSGGADSVTLSLLLPGVAQEMGAAVVALAHLNHQLRSTAGEDERFCRELAARLELPFEVERADVRALARVRRTSLENAGRIARYAFLRRVAVRHGASRIAVAHTRNDQAETVLLRLFRGAGTAGLAAIHPRRGTIIRPLLDVRRSAIEAFLAGERLPFCEDLTNRDVSIPRNRIRHELLPYLSRHAGEGIVDVLARQATMAREDADWLDRAATETTSSLVLEEGARLSVDVVALRALPPALARRVIRSVLARVAAPAARGPRFIGFDHVEAVMTLAGHGSDREAPAARAGGPQGRLPGGGATKNGYETIDLPGQRVQLSKGRLIFEPRAPDPARAGRRRGRPRASSDDPEGDGPGGDGDGPGGLGTEDRE